MVAVDFSKIFKSLLTFNGGVYMCSDGGSEAMCIRFSPDGSVLAAGFADGSIKVPLVYCSSFTSTSLHLGNVCVLLDCHTHRMGWQTLHFELLHFHYAAHLYLNLSNYFNLRFKSERLK
jgi:hypothetical protein